MTSNDEDTLPKKKWLWDSFEEELRKKKANDQIVTEEKKR